MPCPKVNLGASSISRAMDTSPQRQGGHPCATGPRFLDRYVNESWEGPSIWIKTPKATPLLSCTYKEKCFWRSGRAIAGALASLCWWPPEGFVIAGSHSRDSSSGPFRASQRSIVINPNWSIHIRQNTSIPKGMKPLFCRGSFHVKMRPLWWLERLLVPRININPRNRTF